MMEPQTLIRQFGLKAHPEGGYFLETFRTSLNVGGEEVEALFGGSRSAATAIYFLIEEGNFSALHRIKSDEIWHFYEGDPLEVIELDEKGVLKHTQLGRDINNGQQYQYTVKAGVWFGSRVLKGGRFSFVGCTVAPGFDFRDFELAEKEALLSRFPEHREVIMELTR